MEITKRLIDYILKSSVVDDTVEKEREIISFVTTSLSFPPFSVKIVNYDTDGIVLKMELSTV
jgi:hypothetical protein